MDTYYLTDSQDELERLGFQHQIWEKETTDLWRRANFTVGNHILDLGCGPGYTTLNFSRLVGAHGKVTAIDSSEKFISYLSKSLNALELKNVKSMVMNINEVDFPENTFDGIYSRMVMCFIDNPKKVLKKLVGALKPGGKIAITDFFSYSKSFSVIPHSENIQKAIEMIEFGNGESGGNFNIQREIPTLLSELGLKIIDTKAHVRTATPKNPLWQWPESYFKNILPKMVDMNLLTHTDVENFWVDWNQRKADKNSFFLSPILVDVVAVKNH